jgi:hypothetical protein
MIIVEWMTNKEYKKKGTRTTTVQTRRYTKIFGDSEREQAEKFVKEKQQKGYAARIIN